VGVEVGLTEAEGEEVKVREAIGEVKGEGRTQGVGVGVVVGGVGMVVGVRRYWSMVVLVDDSHPPNLFTVSCCRRLQQPLIVVQHLVSRYTWNCTSKHWWIFFSFQIFFPLLFHAHCFLQLKNGTLTVQEQQLPAMHHKSPHGECHIQI
jgi:hypothetical protein